jgi:orotidine-5'-phosphate decarboxylase
VVAAAALPNVRLLTLHAGGGSAMLRAAQEALAGVKSPPALLGVTILTSLDAAALRELRMPGELSSRAVALARLAKKSGLDGVVSSAREVSAIRRSCGRDFLILVPGVRPTTASVNDQSRVATPAEAIRAGADYLVVGRPITAAADPRLSALAIIEEMKSAVRPHRS